jgi:hypothetical protein
MSIQRKMLLGCIGLGAIIGISALVFVHHLDAASPLTVPGQSIQGVSACDDFLHETQSGGSAISPVFGHVTEPQVQAYLDTSAIQQNPGASVTHIWYYDCGKRIFWYAQLTGTFAPWSAPAGVTLHPFPHEYLLFDAKTGNILRSSIGN